MSILLDPADGPRHDGDYSQREMRLVVERDTALVRAESAEKRLEASHAAESRLIIENARLREALSASQACVDKLEAKINSVRKSPLISYGCHPPSRSNDDRQWQIGFTDGLRHAVEILTGLCRCL